MNLSLLSLDQLEGMLMSPGPHSFACNDRADPSYLVRLGNRDRALTERLAVARELLVRSSYQELLGKSLLDSPTAARDYLRIHFAALPCEVFVAVFLDAGNRVIECVELFRGTLTQVSVYPREVVRHALAFHASSVLVAHQHPSGCPEPSHADEYLTKALTAALALIDVRVIDHLVFGGGQFVSLAERGLL